MEFNVPPTPRRIWRWGPRSQEVEEEGAIPNTTLHNTVTTRMIIALRWAAMRAILMFHYCGGQSHKTESLLNLAVVRAMLSPLRSRLPMENQREMAW